MKIITKLTLGIVILLANFGTVIGASVPDATPTPESSGLLSMLTGQLGITEQQAMSGVSAVMEIVKQQLSGTDYTKLLSGAPDLGAVATQATPAAPDTKSTGGTDWLGHISSWTGYSNLGQMAKLTQTLSQLGLSTEMIGKFIKVTLDYVQGSGGADLMGLMAGALK